MEKICQSVLEKCIHIYEEIRGTEDLYTEEYGKFPQCMQIEFFRTISGKTKLSDKKESICFWKYENGKLETVPEIRDQSLFTRDGMFYNIADFKFEIKERHILIQYVLGPRFGRGIEFEIIYKNGDIFFGNEKVIWVS
ncbi:MAG: hypothetical protein ACI4DK_06155 [Lachnospiraceae bacterium]